MNRWDFHANSWLIALRLVSLFITLMSVVLMPVGAEVSAYQFANAPIGLNKFDLFKQYLGTASGGDGSSAYRRVTQAMARKAIMDASGVGVPYFRIAATGFAPATYGDPGDLDLWVRDRASFWALYDQMLSDLQKSGIRVIPTFAWNIAQLPAMTGETVPELLRNPASKSYGLLRSFVTEFVERYRGHPALMFYELTNELNLGADLDLLNRCRAERNPRLCEPIGNYTTSDMIDFTSRLATLIRGLDPSRPISSGFAIPRSAAQRLRRTPEWASKKINWRPDTREEFVAYLTDTHKGVDIISVHIYAKEENRRFGAKDEVDLLNVAQEAASRIGKPLFLGEFGDPDAPRAESTSFTGRMLDRIVTLRVSYSAIWAWEFYQRNPYTTYDNKHNVFSLEPGYTDYLIERIREANATRGRDVSQLKDKDTVAPRVVLTWPLECSVVKKTQEVHAVASDDQGKVKRVEFWLGETKLATDMAPPYQAMFDPKDVAIGEYNLTAKAYDMADNIAGFSSTILIKMNSDKSARCGASQITR